jgi:hypothetical protein
MRIDYEISEQDFIDAQRLAIKNSPIRIVRWTRLLLPLFGVGLLAFLINTVAEQGFSMRFIPAFIFPLIFISLPFLNKNAGKKMYWKTTSLHGGLSLEASEEGLEMKGPSFASQAGWSTFCQYLEDDHAFLLYQNQQVFNIIPKRGLSLDQIAGLRQYFETKVVQKT